ncbi:hypothetical protein RWE15_22610 [Virgibacillus halophilus]|uniref:Uncharacterized protein n=1 Tax=Tigheibacillus halophilus TaxID=361280 RepID=A0ABU5CB83_9BACI|nr:hypothetical protein [Virgibacillus halophilus]
MYLSLRIKKIKKAKFVVVPSEKILPKNAIQKQWQQQCDSCKLVKITPAISKKHLPLWEVAYHDRSDRYILDYFRMSDGKRYEQFGFKSLFD